jgi:acetyl/propionyl-CoA carboxylase alpha subunit
MAKFSININDEIRELEVIRQGGRLHVVFGDGQTAELEIVQTKGKAFLLEQVWPDGRRERIRAAGYVGHGDQRQIWVNGRYLTYDRLRQRGGGSPPDNSLAATIPAVVGQILVQPGDTVAEGDKLILLESMKMVIPIQAPYDGVVTALHCRPGESVAAGIPLIELEKSEPHL